MNPKAAKELIEGVNIIKEERGGSKGPIDEEKSVINFAYASIVSISDINEGERFSRSNIWVKRPGTGPYFAKDYEKILGKKAARKIKADSHIQIEDILE